MATMTDRVGQERRRIDPATPAPQPVKRGRVVRRLIISLGLILLVGAVAFGSRSLLISAFSDGDGPQLSTYEVKKDELLVTVIEDGTLESGKNIDVKCEVAGGSSILWLVEDGAEVKKGDKIVELDAAALEDEINSQRIAYNKARSTVIQAQKNFEVAEISVKEYLEGTFKKELEDAETQITIAQENLRSSKNSLDYAERMFQRGYISELEVESQQFSVKRAELELNSAQTARDVLVKFTKEKMLKDLESAVETAKAAMESEEAAFKLEESKLKRLETQLENCTILAPQDGMVVYANERGGRPGQQSVTIEEGAAVRDRQTILRLPDLSQMQVKVLVHETRVEDLRPGMRARINVQNRDLQGSVTSIANQHEATSFFGGNVKEYATIVKIDGTVQGIKPGMTAEAEILVAHLKDVLTLPVSAIVELHGEFFCWVQLPSGEIEERKLKLGKSNDQFVEILEGIDVGDQVVRSPRQVIDEARESSATVDQVDVSEKFGEAKEVPADTPAVEGGEGSPPFNRPGTGPDGAGRPGAGRGDRGDGERSPGRGRGRGGFDLMQFDADGDGKVSKEEAPEPMRDRFDFMDSNGDGFIDQTDIDEMRKRFSGAGGGRPGGGPPGGGGPGGQWRGGAPGGSPGEGRPGP